MAGFHLADGQPPASHQGTIQAAERLGLLKYHPTINVPDPATGKKKVIAFPLLGDLLWFFRDQDGCFPVNWTIKNTTEDFEKPHGHNKKRPDPQAEEAHQARIAIEVEMYRDAGIRTIQVANSDIPKEVSENLRQMFAWQNRVANVEDQLRVEIVETLNARIPTGVPVFETLRHLLSRHGGTFHDLQVVLYQAIWQRQIKIDLWTPFNIDQPVRPEAKSLITHFFQWFKRGEK